MFSNVMVAFLAGIGLGGWVYSKIYRSSGGNTQSALIVSGSAGFLLFLVVLIVLGILF